MTYKPGYCVPEIVKLRGEGMTLRQIGPKLIRACEQRWFDYLDAPAASVNASDILLAVSSRMEALCLPSIERVTRTMRAAAKREV